MLLSCIALFFTYLPWILALNIVGFCASLAVMPIVILPRVFPPSSRASMLYLMLVIDWGMREFIILPSKDIQRELDWNRVLLIEFLAVSFVLMLSRFIQISQ